MALLEAYRRFIERAEGCYIANVDGNRYIDYIDSWGPMILGHNFPAIRENVLKACEKGLSFGCATEIEVEMAEFICDRIPHVDASEWSHFWYRSCYSAIVFAKSYAGKEIKSSNLQAAIMDTVMPCW